MSACIARVWQGSTRQKDAAVCLEHIKTKGIPGYRAVEGNCGAIALWRQTNGVTEFLVISLWDSTDAIQRFVGSKNITKPVHYPEDQYFGFPETKVIHYDLAAGEVTLDLARSLSI